MERIIVAILLAGMLTSSMAAEPDKESVWTPPEVRCPFGKAPMLDGIVAKGEWDDALVIRKAHDPWPHDTMAQQLNVAYDAADLACAIRMKHDGARLYILCEVTDELLYNLDTEEWVLEKYKERPEPFWKSLAGQELLGGRRTASGGAEPAAAPGAPLASRTKRSQACVCPQPATTAQFRHKWTRL